MKGKHELKNLTLKKETFNSFRDQTARERISMLRGGGQRTGRLMVSFMDDDCRAGVAGPDNANSLEYLIDQKGIPYTLACAPGDILDTNKTGFMSEDDLLRMVGKGVTVSCHAFKQYNMDQFVTEDDFRADIEKCQQQFDQWGIPVETMSYPQGKFVDDYMGTVKEFYRMGFTVNNGINQIPYASYYMDRVGLFKDNESDDGTASLAVAKTYVDQLAEMESGWLIFMTHAWYAGFRPKLLGELIEYIRDKDNIEIVDIHEALNTTGNIVESGVVKKPFEDAKAPFFVLDATGTAHTNALNEYSPDTETLTEMQVGWRGVDKDGNSNWYLHGEKGTLLSHSSDTSRRVSADIPVKAGEVYRVTCCSVWSGAAYAVLGAEKADGTRDVKAIKAGTNKTEFTKDTYEITIPSGSDIMRVSTNLNYQPGGYKICKVEYLGEDINVGNDAPTVNAPDADIHYFPTAGEDLGGVRADPATEEDTQPVRIGEDGKLYTAPGGGGAQADWNQSDPEQPDYVKNRPFYSEGETEYLIEPVELQVVYGEAYPESPIIVNPDDFAVGSVLFVVWNGTVYECIVQYHNMAMWHYLTSNDGTELPFNIHDSDGTGGELTIGGNDYSSVVNVSFALAKSVGKTVPIDIKYLPVDNELSEDGNGLVKNSTIAKALNNRSSDAVQYTEQGLTQAQQMQARRNLGLYHYRYQPKTLMFTDGPFDSSRTYDFEPYEDELYKVQIFAVASEFVEEYEVVGFREYDFGSDTTTLWIGGLSEYPFYIYTVNGVTRMRFDESKMQNRDYIGIYELRVMSPTETEQIIETIPAEYLPPFTVRDENGNPYVLTVNSADGTLVVTPV